MNFKPKTREHLRDFQARCDWPDATKQLENAVEMLCESHRNGGRVLLCGNGGSAADSEHIVGELAKGFLLPRRLHAAEAAQLRAADCDAILAEKLQRGVAAMALTGHAPLATAVQNDCDSQLAFAQQTYVYGKSGDVLIAISTSGNSRNVILALQTARAFGLKTIGLTGESGGQMAPWCDLLFRAPSRETFRIQEFHLPLYHTICAMIEAELFGE